jgi:hypothetical protein
MPLRSAHRAALGARIGALSEGRDLLSRLLTASRTQLDGSPP